MPLVVGVDSSTSARKVQVRDAESGTVVSSARAPHPATPSKLPRCISDTTSRR